MEKVKKSKKEMYKERFRHLLRVLYEVKLHEKSFNMDLWVKKEQDVTCNTTACAIGWFAQDPYAIEKGFHLDSYGNRSTGHPVYRHFQSFEAPKVFFGLSDKMTEYLFDPCEYEEDIVSIDIVIARIETYMKKRFGSVTEEMK